MKRAAQIIAFLGNDGYSFESTIEEYVEANKDTMTGDEEHYLKNIEVGEQIMVEYGQGWAIITRLT